jgi:hypothetical protein
MRTRIFSTRPIFSLQLQFMTLATFSQSTKAYCLSVSISDTTYGNKESCSVGGRETNFVKLALQKKFYFDGFGSLPMTAEAVI